MPLFLDGILQTDVENSSEVPQTFFNGIKLPEGYDPVDAVYDHSIYGPEAGVIPDATDNGNLVVLNTGWAVTLDGITGQVNFPTESAYDIAGKTLIVSGKFRFSTLPASNYSLIGKGFNLGGWMVYIKSDGRMAFISKRAGLGANHSIKRSTSVCPRDVWNTFTLTAVDGVMTGMVLNGANETIVTDLATAGTYGDYTTADLTIGAIQSVPTSTVTYFFAGDLCDFSMTVDGVEILKPKLQDHPPGSLDGLPAFDASGNGNHGTYVGGTSIVGEGMPDSVAKLGAYGDKLWFDGVDDDIIGSAFNQISATLIITYYHGTSEAQFLQNNDNTNSGRRVAITQNFSLGEIGVRSELTSDATGDIIYGLTGVSTNALHTLIVTFDASGDLSGGSLDGTPLVLSVSNSRIASTGTTANQLSIGIRDVGGFPYSGIINSYDDGATTWDGTQADAIAQGWTVNGSPATVADLRRTIPQTALQDWNAGGTGPTAIYESDFSVNVDGWFASSISVSGNQDGINGEDNCLLLNSGVAAGGRFNLNSLTLGMVIGKTYRLDFRYYAATSADDGLFFQIGDEFDSSSYLILEADNQTVIGGSWQTVSLYFTADASGVKLKLTTTNTAALGELNSNISNDFYFKDLVLREWFSSSVYLPEASDNPGFDTFGNAIANPRGYLLNPRGVAGDYAEILDDPSLDVTTEWSGALVGNLYNPNVGTDQMLIGRYDATNNKRSWLLYFNDTSPSRLTVALSSNGTSAAVTLLYSLSDEEAVYSWSYNGGAPSFTFYKNGVALNPTSTGGTIPSSLFTTDIPIRLFQDFNGANPSDKQFGKTLMYNKALSDSEHVKIYRALRRYL
jgi:hypothetical protein